MAVGILWHDRQSKNEYCVLHGLLMNEAQYSAFLKALGVIPQEDVSMSAQPS